MFHSLHAADDDAAHPLHCHDVWFAADLPWDSVAARRGGSSRGSSRGSRGGEEGEGEGGEGGGGEGGGGLQQCLFSVVQSSSLVTPRDVYLEHKRGGGGGGGGALGG
jgi:hypothetical protein